MDALTSVYAAAEAVMADPEVGPLPLASPEPWVEGDEALRTRFARHFGRCFHISGQELDDLANDCGLPRARLVPATPRAEGENCP